MLGCGTTQELLCFCLEPAWSQLQDFGERLGASGELLAPTLRPHGAQKRPRELQALIFDPPGPLWGAFFIYV